MPVASLGTASTPAPVPKSDSASLICFPAVKLEIGSQTTVIGHAKLPSYGHLKFLTLLFWPEGHPMLDDVIDGQTMAPPSK
uniref:hypothetical protein n=1 Tax=Peristeroidobacter agariperforans TaxID=268404 RepID=UPI001E641B37